MTSRARSAFLLLAALVATCVPVQAGAADKVTSAAGSC
jgi:hypothetical protein